jgi:hypothetical protein
MFAAASSTHAQAQEFRIEEASSLAGLAVDGLKPRTIAFVDRPSEELIDPDAGLIRFQDWAQAEAARKAILDTVSELTSTNCRGHRRWRLKACADPRCFSLLAGPGSVQLP